MTKKIAAYCFLTLANILLLAHTAIPHHHHQNLLCYETKHCADDGIRHEHDQPETNHQHDNDPFTNLCLVADDYISASSNSANRTVIYQHYCNNQEFSLNLYSSSGDRAISIPPGAGISFAPLSLPYYCSFCHPPFGSRPPPRLIC